MAFKLFKSQKSTNLNLAKAPEKPRHTETNDGAQADREGGAKVTDEAMEKQVVRKMDRHIIPLLFALYLLSYLDRSDIGNAEVAGVQKNLNLSSGDYQWLLTIFYISYILFEWFTLMWKAVPPAAMAVLGWGIVSSAQGGVQNWSGMMALRFLMGAFEAGFGPGVPYYLSFFYLRHEIGLRIGLFLSAAPLATCFAGALAYGISHGHTSIAPWRVLFLVEGLPTICMGRVAYMFLPDTPQKARFLSEDEKKITLARGVRQVGEDLPKRIGRVEWREVISTLLDYKGFNSINSQGLSAPPYFIAFLMVIGTTFIADKTQQRGFVIITVSLIGAIGYIILATCSSVGARYTGVFFAATGVFPAIINVLPWCLNNQTTDTKRGIGIVILNAIGQCSPLLGTRRYPATEKPLYRKGQWVCAAFLLFNCVLALTYRTLLARENKRLDRQYGISGEGNDNGAGGVQSAGSSRIQLVGDENEGPKFRYVL